MLGPDRLRYESDMAYIWCMVAEVNLVLPHVEASTSTNAEDPTLDNLLFALETRPSPIFSTARAYPACPWDLALQLLLASLPCEQFDFPQFFCSKPTHVSTLTEHAWIAHATAAQLGLGSLLPHCSLFSRPFARTIFPVGCENSDDTRSSQVLYPRLTRL